MKEISHKKLKRLMSQSWRKRKQALGLIAGEVQYLEVRVRTVRADGSPKHGRIAFTRGEKAKIFTSGEWY